jgi:hypothetical protein
MLKKCSSFADVRASFLRPYKHVTRAHSARYAQENQGRVAKGRKRGTGRKKRLASHGAKGRVAKDEKPEARERILRGHNMCDTRPTTRVGRGVGKRGSPLFF